MATSARTEYIELPTYEVGGENPNPWFTKRLGGHIYPYRLQNRLTGKRAIRRWEAVILENEYLRLMFLPDFGCRLFSAYDKLLGREVFYRNDCIKPALIATRGAWISGGVEFNFPVSHSVYTHSRIPYTTRQNTDGSASIIFGHTERMTEMRWSLEARLAPGEYRFSDRVRLFNGTDLPHRHYWWTNAGVQATPDTQLIYPMTRGISGAYGGEPSWPVHEGSDLSRVTNHPFACDVFGAETYDEFFGVYHWGLKCGLAHWARQDELPARKVFLWGLDDMGKLWQKMLTESAGDYMEIQAGRFATQSDFDLLMPHELVEFAETWIPVGCTDGFVKAHPEGIVNVRPAGEGSEIIVQGTRYMPDATIQVLKANRTVEDTKIDLMPGSVVRFEVQQAPDGLSIALRDASGELLRYDPSARENVHDIVPRTSVMPGKTDTPDEILRAAQVHERMDEPAHAEEKWNRLLGTQHEIAARKGIARLRLRAGRWEDAADQARAILSDGPDSDAMAYLAIATRELGDADMLWLDLIEDPAYGRLAKCHLALVTIKNGGYISASDICEGESSDPALGLLAAACARKSGNTSRATAIVSGLLDADPLWRHALWERHFLTTDSIPSLKGETFQEDMDAAGWYRELGMCDEVRAIVAAWIEAGPPKDPFLDALIAELGLERPEECREDEPGIVNCFAHRDALMRMLSGSQDKEASLHMGNMLYMRGRIDEAMGYWHWAGDGADSSYLPHRNLALAFWHHKDDVRSAYRFMLKACAINPQDPDSLRDLDILAELTGEYAARPGIADLILEHAPDDSGCLERGVRIFLESGELDKAVDLITTRQFFVAELAYQTRILYVRALVERGTQLLAEGRYEDAAHDFRRATEYPSNLGASRFHDSSDAQACYLLGLALDKLGRVNEATEVWKQAADDRPVAGSEQAFYVGRARERLNRPDASEAFDAIKVSEAQSDTPQARGRRHYLTGLRHLALGESELADSELVAAWEIEQADRTRMHKYLESVFYTRSEGRRVPIAVWWTAEPAPRS